MLSNNSCIYELQKQTKPQKNKKQKSNIQSGSHRKIKFNLIMSQENKLVLHEGKLATISFFDREEETFDLHYLYDDALETHVHIGDVKHVSKEKIKQWQSEFKPIPEIDVTTLK